MSKASRQLYRRVSSFTASDSSRPPGSCRLAVSYMIPLINYGDIITDPHGVAFVLGLMEEEYYRAVCQLADFVGAEKRMPSGPGCSLQCC